MAHPRHVHVHGGIYLVSAVADRNREVFADDADRVSLGDRVAEVIRRCSARVHAFNWLPTELLLVLEVAEVPVSEVMRLLISAHARRVNARLRRKGALFRRPHRQVLLENDASLLQAVRVVHQGRSPWSSRGAYGGSEEISWLTRDRVFLLLAHEQSDQGNPHMAAAERPGSPVALETERTPSPLTQAPRPFDAFLSWLKSETVHGSRRVSLDVLALRVADWLEIPASELESRAGGRLLSLARALIAWYAMQYRIASLRELSLRFRRARSTISGNRDSYRKWVPALFELPLETVLTGPGVPVQEIRRLLSETGRRSS
jgi:hypothetical protein